MSINKVMTMFALLTGIACATYAQGVTNDSTATAKSDGLKLVKEVYPQAEEDGGLVPRPDEETDVRPHDTATRSGGDV